MNAESEITAEVKRLALEAGFARAGVAPVDAVPGRCRYEAFLAAGRHAAMDYLARNVDVRFAPAELVPGARSVLCLAASYAPAGPEPAGPFVARYARGRDYHKVLRKRGQGLCTRLAERFDGFRGRVFVDAAPVAERSLAVGAGLGWIGRNGCLVAPGLGSYVLLCEILSNLPLRPDGPLDRACEDCRACQAACPTGAIVDAAVVDCRLCLSYLTIEHREDIPADLRAAVGNRLFGCDTCQAVCPYNRDVPPGDPELTGPPGRTSGPGLEAVLGWGPETWDQATRGRALRRAGFEGLLRNAILVAGCTDRGDLAGAIEAAARRTPSVRPAAEWTLKRLGGG